jgi:hypothetical protein
VEAVGLVVAGLLVVEPPLLQPATRIPTTANNAKKHQTTPFFILSPPDIVFSREHHPLFEQAFPWLAGPARSDVFDSVETRPLKSHP